MLNLFVTYILEWNVYVRRLLRTLLYITATKTTTGKSIHFERL